MLIEKHVKGLSGVFCKLDSVSSREQRPYDSSRNQLQFETLGQ